MKHLLFIACAALSITASAAEFTIDQTGNKFSQTALKIKVGDTIVFRNNDAHFHNIFSLTDGHGFDLGSFGQGQTRRHTFGKPGKVEVECAIHPSMKLVVEVAP